MTPQFVAKPVRFFLIVYCVRNVFFLKSVDLISEEYSLTLIHLSSGGNAVFVAIGYK
jgi:hypothetical protein